VKKTPILRPKYADTEDGPGTGRLLFPKGAPCDLCGKPVLTPRGNIFVVLEPEPGNRFWSIQHRRCVRRKAETKRRRDR